MVILGERFASCFEESFRAKLPCPTAEAVCNSGSKGTLGNYYRATSAHSPLGQHRVRDGQARGRNATVDVAQLSYGRTQPIYDLLAYRIEWLTLSTV